MLTVYFNDKPYNFPNRWEELTAEQFLWLIPMLAKLWAGEMSLFNVRVEWFKKIAGLESLKLGGEKLALAADNIYTISRQLDFFFTIDYDGKIDAFSPEVRRLLSKKFPDDISGGDVEIRLARKLEYTLKPDMVWIGNLLPEIAVSGRKLKGWQVSVCGDALTATLTAKQALQGNDALLRISRTGKRDNMAMLAAVLYPAQPELSFEEYRKLSDDILYGIILNFQAFMSFIFTRTYFSILWNKEADSSDKEQGIPGSLTHTLYSLSRSGYGDYKQIEDMPFITYLSIIRKDTIDMVRTMYESKVRVDEIAQRTKMPIETISKIIG